LQSDFSLRIIHVNDHHSHIEPEEVAITIDASFPASLQSNKTIPVDVGGWPLITAAIDEAKQEGEEMGMNVLKLHAGDAITGTIFFTLFQGLADASFMNSVCFDAFELGNHEFDDGDAGLVRFLDFLDGANNTNPERCPKIPVLAANVVPGPNSPLVGRLLPFKIFTYKGTKVGVIGINIRLKTLQSSFPDPGTNLLDEATVATAQIAELKKKGVDIIILLTHVGLNNDLSNLAKLPGVDVVVGGDSHTFMGYTPPVPIEEKMHEYPGIYNSSYLIIKIHHASFPILYIPLHFLQSTFSSLMDPIPASFRRINIQFYLESWMLSSTKMATFRAAKAVQSSHSIPLVLV
jgi:5'-nucleotidase / UDP-sugar diphosphatase